MSNTISTTTAGNPKSQIPNPKSPRLRPPSDRDLEIYKRVKITGLQHWEVAQEFEIDRTRVSQIVKRVTRWLAAGGQAIDPLIRDLAARQRLAQGDIKLRLQQAIQFASHALEFRFPLETTRRRIQGVTEVWREETKRDVPHVSLTALRILLDATKSLEQLERHTQSPSDKPSQASENDLLRAVFDFLCGCRSRAESAGRLPVTENIPVLIATTLTTVLGLPADQLASYVPSAQPTNDQASQNAHLALTVSASTPSPIDATPNSTSPSIDSSETPPS